MIDTMGSNKEARKNFAHSAAQAKKWVPGPNYGQTDWKLNFKGNRGKFLGKQRKTFTDDIMEYEKKLPAPSKYTNMVALKNRERIPGVYNA